MKAKIPGVTWTFQNIKFGLFRKAGKKFMGEIASINVNKDGK
jgi:hypothetical protein